MWKIRTRDHAGGQTVGRPGCGSRRSNARIVEASLGGYRVGRIAMLPEEARARPDARRIRLRRLQRWRDRGPGPWPPSSGNAQLRPAERSAPAPQAHGHGDRRGARPATAGHGGGRNAQRHRPGRMRGAGAGRCGRKRMKPPVRAPQRARTAQPRRERRNRKGLWGRRRRTPRRIPGSQRTHAAGDHRQWPLPAVSYQP